MKALALILALAGPATPGAIGTADACDGSGYCETFEHRYASMPGCQIGLMRDLPEWLSQKVGDWHLQGRYRCKPANQTDV